MPTNRVFKLSIVASLENLHEIRQFIDHAGESLGVNLEAIEDLRLVVDEAVTNVVLHGYNGEGGDVDISVNSDADAVVIHIRDQAKSFDDSDVHDPQLDTSLSERPFGGMGVFLIHKMTDESEYRALPGGGNELRLVKRGAISG